MKSKLKTHKGLIKRVKLTKNGKIFKKTSGQDHFNSREPGKVTRNKRREREIDKTNVRTLKRMLPYNV